MHIKNVIGRDTNILHVYCKLHVIICYNKSMAGPQVDGCFIGVVYSLKCFHTATAAAVPKLYTNY